MGRMRIFSKFKKGFTLVELLAVVVLIGIASSIAIPNLYGTISSTDLRKYKSYCMLATSFTKNYTNALNSGEDRIPYVDDYGKYAYYTISTRDGLTAAMNEHNPEAGFTYYALDFASAFSVDPSSTLTDLIKKGKMPKKDVIVVCIIKTTHTNSRATYELKGLWYYNYEKQRIVATYFVKKNIVGSGSSEVTYKPGEVKAELVAFTSATK